MADTANKIAFVILGTLCICAIGFIHFILKRDIPKQDLALLTMSSPWSDQTILVRTELKRLRLAAELTQTELALRLGKPQSYVSKAESGDRTLDLLEVRDFCTACGSNFAEFTQALDRQLVKLTRQT